MKEYGLLIEHVDRYGTEHIVVRPIAREEGRDGILGCSGDGESEFNANTPKHLIGLQLDGLCLDGFVSDLNSGDFIGFEHEFREVYSIDMMKLKRMSRTLKRVSAQQQRDKAYEPGDRFMSLAKALKSSFVAYRRKKVSHDGERFGFMSVIDGRNYLRRVIEEAQAEAKARNKVA